MLTANCRGQAPVFDAAIHDEDARAIALDLCATCRELAQRRQWYDSLSHAVKPLGVCAGQFKARKKRTQTGQNTGCAQRRGTNRRSAGKFYWPGPYRASQSIASNC